MQHLFIDAVGGVAGDMFAAALLDARPELTAPLLAALEAAGLGEIAEVRADAFSDGTLTGTHFFTAPVESCSAPTSAPARHHAVPGGSPNELGGELAPSPAESRAEGRRDHAPGAHHHPPADGASHHHHHPAHEASHHRHHPSGGASHHHGHRQHADIVRWLGETAIEPAVRARAVDIFAHLAQAEAEVHGIAVDEVTFHEVGAWDSIADVVSAAWLIEAYGEARWHYAPLPVGRGRVATAHGWLPVPAPATALLLEGFALYQDHLDGERITPTGAAILKHLAPSAEPITDTVRLAGTGTGFGSKRFPGISNVLRISRYVALQDAGRSPRSTAASRNHHSLGTSTTEPVGVCEFEIDDQSPEDLALGLERLRALPEVLDVLQSPAFGKKGRMVTQVRILTTQAGLGRVVDAALVQTTTLGVRWRLSSRTVLGRVHDTLALEAGEVRVKRARRPGGHLTAKIESDDLSHLGEDAAERARLRREAEALALIPRGVLEGDIDGGGESNPATASPPTPRESAGE